MLHSQSIKRCRRCLMTFANKLTQNRLTKSYVSTILLCRFKKASKYDRGKYAK